MPRKITPEGKTPRGLLRIPPPLPPRPSTANTSPSAVAEAQTSTTAFVGGVKTTLGTSASPPFSCSAVRRARESTDPAEGPRLALTVPGTSLQQPEEGGTRERADAHITVQTAVVEREVGVGCTLNRRRKGYLWEWRECESTSPSVYSGLWAPQKHCTPQSDFHFPIPRKFAPLHTTRQTVGPARWEIKPQRVLGETYDGCMQLTRAQNV